MTGNTTFQEALPPDLLAAIAARGGRRSWPVNTVLIHEGDSSDSLYIMLAGRVKVFSSGENGREIVLSEHGPGEYFGELSLDGDRRSVSIMTLEPTTCCIVQGADMRQLLAEQPDFALHLTRKLIGMVRRLTEQVKSLALQDVYGRVVRLFNELAQPEGEVRVLRQRLTQQDIADRVGSSREMVNRVLKELLAGGYIVQRADKHFELRKKLPAAW